MNTDIESQLDLTNPASFSGLRKAYLDPEVAGEGTKVILSDGNQVTYNPPAAKPTIPDISNIKAIRHYFGRTDHYVFPTWVYHPTQPDAIAKNAQEAWEKFGLRLIETTDREQRQYNVGKYRWEMTQDWSIKPYRGQPFDPANPGHGKNYMAAPPNPRVAQNELLAELVPTVTAAVVTALKSGGQAPAPAHLDAKTWDEFLEFQAFKKTQAALDPLGAPADVSFTKAGLEREEWEMKAKEVGIKVDGRWSLDRLKKEVEQKMGVSASGVLSAESPDQAA